jgi:hypothetical protein
MRSFPERRREKNTQAPRSFVMSVKESPRPGHGALKSNVDIAAI